MALILQKTWQGYLFMFEDIVDPRTKSWLLVAKPYQGMTILGLYLMFVLKWGPKWMKNRKPFNLDKILIVYNAFQVIACAYLFTKSITEAWGWKYKWICEPVDHSNTPSALEICRLVYVYFLLKLLDLLDTVFFVLRKKYNQVSFLHIYHHTGMVVLIWGAVTYLPGGHGTLIGVINSFVHTVMYSYYLLTVAVPSIKNAIWIKKHVTQLQILQFFWCVLHMVFIVFKTDCEYPRWTAAVFLPQNLFMLALFTDFYIKTYVKKPKEKLVSKKNSEQDNNAKHENNNIYKNGIKTVDNEVNTFTNSINKINNSKGYFETKNCDSNISSIRNNKCDINLNIHDIANGNLPFTNGKNKTNCHYKQA